MISRHASWISSSISVVATIGSATSTRAPPRPDGCASHPGRAAIRTSGIDHRASRVVLVGDVDPLLDPDEILRAGADRSGVSLASEMNRVMDVGPEPGVFQVRVHARER